MQVRAADAKCVCDVRGRRRAALAIWLKATVALRSL